jgi:hypothetical protein
MGFLGQLFGGGASNFTPVVNAASNNATADQGQGTSLFNQGQNINNLLTPFYQQQLTNPQGIGATALSQQLTQAGESTGGALGAERQHAMDIGARTGNTAAIPSMIAGANKTGMTNMTDLTNNLALKNTMMKMNQQQQAGSALSGLLGTDISGAHGFESNANTALNTDLSATAQKNQAANQGMSNIMKLAGGVMGGLPMGAGSIGDIGSNILGGMS